MNNSLQKKIAFVAYDLNPTKGSECGKADLWLKIISRHFEVIAFIDQRHEDDIMKEKYENVSFSFINLPHWQQKLSDKTNFVSIANFTFTQKVKKILSNYSDISLIHCITPAGIHSFNSLYTLNIPVIVGPLGGALNLPKGFRFKTGISTSLLRTIYYFLIKFLPQWRNYLLHASTILIGTENLRNKLPDQCRSRAQIFFDTAVNPNIFVPSEQKTNKVTICYIARLESHKGIKLFLRACQSLLQEYDNIELIIAGAGSLSHSIPLNNLKIRYLGPIPREEVVAILQKSDIYCLPTLREPGGVSILEAMSCALPVVTTNYGGPAISVTDECGYKIEPLNETYYIEQLQIILKKLIENAELRKKMGLAGRKRVEMEFSPEAIEKKIIKIYEETLIS